MLGPRHYPRQRGPWQLGHSENTWEQRQIFTEYETESSHQSHHCACPYILPRGLYSDNSYQPQGCRSCGNVSISLHPLSLWHTLASESCSRCIEIVDRRKAHRKFLPICSFPVHRIFGTVALIDRPHLTRWLTLRTQRLFDASNHRTCKST